MEAVSVVLILLLAVVVSGTVSRMLPLPIPAPLVQIALGCAIGLAADLRVVLDPELFLLLFLPPLLFLDGWRIPKDELLKDISTVVELALGLVLLTVVGIFYLVLRLFSVLQVREEPELDDRPRSALERKVNIVKVPFKYGLRQERYQRNGEAHGRARPGFDFCEFGIAPHALHRGCPSNRGYCLA